MRPARLLVALVVVGAVLLPAVPAQGQDPTSTTTTTTTTSSTSTTAAPSESTTTTAPPPLLPVPSTVPPGPVLQLEQLVGTVNEASGSYASQAPFDAGAANRVMAQELRAAERALDAAQDGLDSVVARQAELEVTVVELRAQLDGLDAGRRAVAAAVEAAQLDFEDRVADAFIRGSGSASLAFVLATPELSDVAHGLQFLDSVLDTDLEAIEGHAALRDRLDAEVSHSVELLVHAQQEATSIDAQIAVATADVMARVGEVEVWRRGSHVFVDGFRFPVAGPVTFIDSFGFPRMPGTPDEHWHEGTDVFAAMGTPLVACEGGTILSIGSGRLGGNSVWLVGDSGIHYYYAHLSGFADGLVAGQRVEPGAVLGFVGDTGNARGTSPHLHFEVHPGGGDAVNPYPILRWALDQLGAQQVLASPGLPVVGPPVASPAAVPLVPPG